MQSLSLDAMDEKNFIDFLIGKRFMEQSRFYK